VNAYLENPPEKYENVPFPNLSKDKVVGLVTIKPKAIRPILKRIHTIPANSIFYKTRQQHDATGR
jgi:hypothetical protein